MFFRWFGYGEIKNWCTDWFYKLIHTWTQNIVCLSSSFFFSPSFFLSFPSIQKLYVHLSARQAVEQMSSLFFSLTHLLASLSLALSVSCGLWFVPNWNCLKATTQSPLHQAKQRRGGTKPARGRINQESRWRRVCAKLQTGAAQPRHNHHTLAVLARKILLTTWSAPHFLTAWQARNSIIHPFKSGVRAATVWLEDEQGNFCYLLIFGVFSSYDWLTWCLLALFFQVGCLGKI